MQDYVVDYRKESLLEQEKLFNFKPIWFNKERRKWEFKSVKPIITLFGV